MKRGHDVTVLEASGIVGGHVRTVRDGLADGLYVDAGAEHFTKPGYDLYWSYVREFDLPYIEDLRRQQMIRLIGDRMYSEQELADTRILASFGFNQREVEFLKRQPWPELAALYLDKYTSAFADEYKPFVAGLTAQDYHQRPDNRQIVRVCHSAFHRRDARPGLRGRRGGDPDNQQQCPNHHARKRARGPTRLQGRTGTRLGRHTALLISHTELDTVPTKFKPSH